MSKTSLLTILGLVNLAVVTPVHAAAPTPSDLVAASFDRILTEEKDLPAPPSPTSTSADPLYQLVTAAQWNTDSVAGAPAHAIGKPVKQN
jgi:hypothetical protein